MVLVRRGAVLAALAALSLSGCARSPADRLVASLREQPGQAPPALGPDQQAILVELNVGPGGIAMAGRPVAQPGTRLVLERALASRRTEPPAYWIVLSSADGARVRYWAAASGQTRVRTTEHHAGSVRASMKALAGGLASVRLPFAAGGRIDVYEAAGEQRASFRFGERPDAPLTGGASFPQDDGCPQVWRIHGAGGPGERLGILFVGDGFTREELPVYRCGVALMTQALGRRHPFDTIAHAIDVYRMDLVAPSSGIEVPKSCPQSDPSTFGPFTSTPESGTLLAECSGLSLAAGEPVHPPDSTCEACAETRLGFFNDPAVSPDCRVVWAGAEAFRRVWSLTRCAPNVDVVIVVANSAARAGAGTSDSAPPISVATLWNVATDGSHGLLVSHELGHALGLLDEYAEPTGEPPEYQGGRNVVRRLAGGSIEPAPWADQCVDASGKPVAPCVVVQGTTCSATAPPEQALPKVGLFEGSFYHPCGYFRAQEGCLLDEERVLCVGCRAYLRSLFRDLGLLREDGSPPAPPPTAPAP